MVQVGFHHVLKTGRHASSRPGFVAKQPLSRCAQVEMHPGITPTAGIQAHDGTNSEIETLDLTTRSYDVIGMQ